MGFVSYQEDNHDAAGEPVKAGKQKGQVIKIEETDKLIESDPKMSEVPPFIRATISQI